MTLGEEPASPNRLGGPPRVIPIILDSLASNRDSALLDGLIARSEQRYKTKGGRGPGQPSERRYLMLAGRTSGL